MHNVKVEGGCYQMPDAGSICFVARLVIPSATDGAHLSHCALHKLFNATIEAKYRITKSPGNLPRKA